MGNNTSFQDNNNSKNMSSAQELVKSAVASNKVVIFSKSYCPYCRSAKNLFANVPDKQIFELDRMGSNGNEIQRTLQQMTGQRTVPNIFVNGQHLGGNDDAQAAHRTGRLQQLLTVQA